MFAHIVYQIVWDGDSIVMRSLAAVYNHIDSLFVQRMTHLLTKYHIVIGADLLLYPYLLFAGAICLSVT